MIKLTLVIFYLLISNTSLAVIIKLYDEEQVVNNYLEKKVPLDFNFTVEINRENDKKLKNIYDKLKPDLSFYDRIGIFDSELKSLNLEYTESLYLLLKNFIAHVLIDGRATADVKKKINDGPLKHLAGTKEAYIKEVFSIIIYDPLTLELFRTYTYNMNIGNIGIGEYNWSRLNLVRSRILKVIEIKNQYFNSLDAEIFEFFRYEPLSFLRPILNGSSDRSIRLRQEGTSHSKLKDLTLLRSVVKEKVFIEKFHDFYINYDFKKTKEKQLDDFLNHMNPLHNDNLITQERMETLEKIKKIEKEGYDIKDLNLDGISKDNLWDFRNSLESYTGDTISNVKIGNYDDIWHPAEYFANVDTIMNFMKGQALNIKHNYTRPINSLVNSYFYNSKLSPNNEDTIIVKVRRDEGTRSLSGTIQLASDEKTPGRKISIGGKYDFYITQLLGVPYHLIQSKICRGYY